MYTVSCPQCCIWAVSCKTVSSGICRQRRPRLACASAQSDQGLRSPPTELLDTIKSKCPDETVHARDESESVLSAHV